MKIYRKVTIPAREEEVLVTHSCDFCNTEEQNWKKKSSFDIISTSISYSSIENYGDSCYGEKFQADVCPKCFVEKVIPALQALGCAAKLEDVDLI